MLYFFFLLIPLPPRSTLFPYTTLFRSQVGHDLWQSARLFPDTDHAHVKFAEEAGMFFQGRREGGALFNRLGDLQDRSEEHTSELQSQSNIVCRLLLEKKKETLCRQLLR